jgi:hypothetical protein
VAELRKLSEHCNFGTTLNDMLRNRLVCGVGDQRIQRRLLAEPDLTSRFPAVLALTLLEAAFVGLVFTTSTTIAASPTLSMGVFPRTCKFIILLDEAAYLLPAPECFPLPPRLPCQFEGFGEHKLQPSTQRLRTYTDQELDIQGSVTVDITYNSQQETLPLLIVAGKTPSLLGRDWPKKIRLDSQALHHLQALSPKKSWTSTQMS